MTTASRNTGNTSTQNKSTRTGTGKVAIAPVNTIKLADVNAGTQKINQWLKKNTGDMVDLDTLKMVAGSLPVIGNIIALTDAVYDVIEITEKPNPGFPDWLNLGIDLVGVIPLPPGLAASRMALRPALKTLKSKNLAKQIPDTIIELLTIHVNERVAGELSQFAEKAQPLVKKTVDDCGNKAKELGNNFADGMSKVLSGKLFSTGQDIKSAKSSLTKVGENALRNPLKAFSHGVDFLASVGAAGAKEYGNMGAKVATSFLDSKTKNQINKQIGNFRKFSNTVPTKLAPLADPGTAMSFSWLLQNLMVAAKKYKLKQKHTVSIRDKQVSSKEKKRANGELETIQHQKKPNNNPNTSCEINTNGAKGNPSKKVSKTSNSITYALGTEFLTHIDAYESSISSFVLSRTYASNLYQLDHGEFGARWLTPFTTRIIPKTEYVEGSEEQQGYTKELKGFQYIGTDARPIALPDIKVGESIHDQQEGFYYSIISDNLKMISFGLDEKHLFEKYLDGYRLSVIEYKNGVTAAIRYDHKIEEKSYISDILIKHKDQQLLHVAFGVNSDGRIIDVWTVENGQLKRPLASYNYNEKGELVEAITENGSAYKYQYDHHLLTRYTDLTGRGMNLEYDGIEPISKAFHEWADDGSSDVRLEWDENIRLTYVIDAYGNETEYYYDIEGYTYRIVYPDDLEEWYFRDECNRVVRHIDTDAATTEYEFDDNGNLVTVTQADGATVYYDYDDKDQMIGMVDAVEGRWFREYDGQGNIVKAIDPLKRETTYSYNAMGLPTQITDAKGGTKKLKYDNSGNLVSYTDCSGKETKWEYDSRGRVKSVENALKDKVEYFYSEFTTEERRPRLKGLPLNAFGQLDKIKYSDSSEEYFIHDAEGRLLAHIDSNGLQTKYEYDAAGLISLRIDPQNYKIKYQWDKLGRLKRLINENGAHFEFFYDVVGRLVKEIDFDGKETLYEYEETNGHLKTSIEVAMSYGQNLNDRTVSKDRIQQFVLDRMGRLEQRISGYGHVGQPLENIQVEEFAFNSHDQILLAKNSDSKVEWFYDLAGNLIREHIQDHQTAKTAVWKHGYDELNDRVKTVRPDGQKISWLTYGTGHVYGLVLNGKDIVSFERDDLHREIARHYANGLSQSEHYDELGRLSSQIIVNDHENGYSVSDSQKNNALKETQQLLSRIYQYDKTGHLSQIHDTRRGDILYKYDPLGRLLEATSKLGKEIFSFDPASNILNPFNQKFDDNFTGSHQVTTDGYRHNHLVNNVVKDYLEQQYQYDAYGQLIKQKTRAGDLSLVWDVLGRLIKSRNTQFTAEYRYDAMGRRLTKQSKHHYTGHEQHIVYGWDGDTLAYESDGNATRHYIYEKDSFIPLIQAVHIGDIQLHSTPVWNDKYSFNRDPLWTSNQQSQGFNDIWFYHCDHLGTPQEMSDSQGQIIWKAQYKAWGECKAEKSESNFFENSEIITNNIRFQGQYYDEETGLHYNRHRYYSPYVGRFISKDPIGLLGGHNVYAYAPNPVEWVDPRGLTKRKSGKTTGSGSTSKKTHPCPKKTDPCDGKDPSKTARSWQGSKPYTGIDAYKNVVVKKGTVLYTLYPHGDAPGNYLATSPDVLKAGTARGYNDAVQVAHKGNWSDPRARDMRTQLHAFIVTKDTCVAKGRTAANPHLGAGGGTQYFIENLDKKNLLSTGRIIKYDR